MHRAQIDAFIKRYLTQITLIGSVLGLFPLIMYLNFYYDSEFVWGLFEWVTVVKPNLEFQFYGIYNTSYYMLANFGYLYLPIIFYFAMLFSGFAYKNKSPFSGRLIRFVYAVLFMGQITGILWGVSYFFTIEVDLNMGFYLFMSLAFNLLWLYVSFTVIRVEPKHPVDEFGHSVKTTEAAHKEAITSSRFVHHLVDSIMYVGLWSGILLTFVESNIFDAIASINGFLPFFIINIAARLLYYPIFETLFGATPGKFLTGSKVVNEDGSAISLDQSLGRTLSRMVPFEPLSFLGKSKGWHDAWTKTKVVTIYENTDFQDDFGSDDILDHL